MTNMKRLVFLLCAFCSVNFIAVAQAQASASPTPTPSPLPIELISATCLNPNDDATVLASAYRDGWLLCETGDENAEGEALYRETPATSGKFKLVKGVGGVMAADYLVARGVQPATATELNRAIQSAPRLALRIEPLIVKARRRQPIPISLIVMNYGSEPISRLAGCFPGGGFTYRVRDDTGKPVPAKPSPPCANTVTALERVPPHGDTRISIDLERFVSFEQRGTYTLFVTADFRTRSLVSNTIKIVIKN